MGGVVNVVVIFLSGLCGGGIGGVLLSVVLIVLMEFVCGVDWLLVIGGRIVVSLLLGGI